MGFMVGSGVWALGAKGGLGLGYIMGVLNPSEKP